VRERVWGRKGGDRDQREMERGWMDRLAREVVY